MRFGHPHINEWDQFGVRVVFQDKFKIAQREDVVALVKPSSPDVESEVVDPFVVLLIVLLKGDFADFNRVVKERRIRFDIFIGPCKPNGNIAFRRYAVGRIDFLNAFLELELGVVLIVEEARGVVKTPGNDVVPTHSAGTYPQNCNENCEKICNFVLQCDQNLRENNGFLLNAAR